MTEDEKKEFEEFLKWKAEKAEKEAAEKQNALKDDDVLVEDNKEETKENTPKSSSDSDKGDINVLPIVIAVIVILLLFLMVGKCSSSKTSAPADEDYVVDDSVEVVEADNSNLNSEPVAKTWDFTIEKDPMSDTNNVWASIQSDDYITQDFPYDGYTYARITVRYMKKYGYDVLIKITKGQINGRSYYNTDYITARFDNGSPQKYYFNEADDGSSTVVFLRRSSDFIKKCKQAKDIKIDIPIYKGGRPVFSFHVDEPLVWRNE
jgi:hypothetical protein